MAEKEEMQGEEEHPMEERTLHLLQDSKIDQELSGEKARKKGGKKHKMRWMKRPMAIPQTILELQDEVSRENALRCLSNFLIEDCFLDLVCINCNNAQQGGLSKRPRPMSQFSKREEDPDNYYRTGFLLFNSCATMTILMQEVVTFYRKMVDVTFNVRCTKRVINVLTLLQSVAANDETRKKFIDSCVPNFLVPFIVLESTEEACENLRAISLSIIGILCQAKEPEAIQWAIESNMVRVCRRTMEIGNELSKVIAMHILESMLQDSSGLSHICNPLCDHLLGLMETWMNLVSILALYQDLSPRLLFHVIRCYVLLCNHAVGLETVKERLPDAILDDTFQYITEEFPVIAGLRHQLLLNIGIDVDNPISRKIIFDTPMKGTTSIPSDCENAKLSWEEFDLRQGLFYFSPASLHHY